MLDKHYPVELTFLRDLPVKYQAACRLILTHEPLFSIYYCKNNIDVFDKYFRSHVPVGSDLNLVYKCLVLTKLTYLNPTFFQINELRWLVKVAMEMLEKTDVSISEVIVESQHQYPVFSQWLVRCVKSMQNEAKSLSTGVIKDTPEKDIAWCK